MLIRQLPGERVATIRNPFDGRAVGEVPVHDAAAVDEAVVRALAALDAGELPTWRRAEILDRTAVVLAASVEGFARTIAEEAAKPLKTARVEVQRAASTFAFAAAAARTLVGEMVPMDASEVGVGKLGFTLRVPIGVIGAISPFNFPLNLVAHKVAPAIASGCPIVLKPAGQTPLSALGLRRVLVEDCGLPPAWFQVVTGPGSTVGQRLVEHPDIAMITFTGSPDVGWSIRQRAPQKKVTLELGNNAPVIIHADADWREAAARIKVAGFSHAGQSCISTQRIYVHRSIAEPFVETLVAGVDALVIGDPLDAATDVSALINPGETERVASWIDEAVAAGASIATGGGVEGTVLRPTVLTGVKPDMKVSALEVFGPVVGVAVYDDVEDALDLANDTRYGLQAAIWTNDLGLAMRAARRLRFGGVLVNEVPTWRTDQMPYGGERDSGNTREGPAWAVREMTQERLIVLPAP
jgi:acyl-CoA reductase-like NAD-dependent aldehyde dehydrogenase